MQIVITRSVRDVKRFSIVARPADFASASLYGAPVETVQSARASRRR
jgi:hypothetical protein